MKIGKDRKLLVAEIQDLITAVAQYDDKMESIATELKDVNNISKNLTFELLGDKSKVDKVSDIQILLLLGEQLNIKLSQDMDFIKEWLSPIEIKKLRNFYMKDEEESIKLPMTFKPAIKIKDDLFIIGVDKSVIAQLWEQGLTEWDEENQREGKKVKIANGFITIPTVHEKNVKEIKEEILKGTFDETEIAYNCLRGTADNGIEVTYNEDTFELTIHEGTTINILDGMHRTLGIFNSYLKDNTLQGKIQVRLSNTFKREEKKFQVSLSKSTPLSKSRIEELTNSLPSILVNQLKIEGELAGKISSKDTPDKKAGEIVSFRVLVDAFNKYVEIKNTMTANELVKEFNEYLMFLFGKNEDKINDKNNLMFENKVFAGHVYLFSKCKEFNIKPSDMVDFLGTIDFSRDNPLWVEYEVLKSDKTITNSLENKIVKAFDNFGWEDLK